MGAKRCIECADGYERKSEEDKECIKVEVEEEQKQDEEQTDEDEAQGGGNSPDHDEL